MVQNSRKQRSTDSHAVSEYERNYESVYEVRKGKSFEAHDHVEEVKKRKNECVGPYVISVQFQKNSSEEQLLRERRQKHHRNHHDEAVHEGWKPSFTAPQEKHVHKEENQEPV
ncbi:hypothetical protein AS158_00155 [Thermotoga sp. 38H-to]|nr:hypothetical protein AS158_00155 [Thermotoga sp. 38H-to]